MVHYKYVEFHCFMVNSTKSEDVNLEYHVVQTNNTSIILAVLVCATSTTSAHLECVSTS